MTYVYTGTTRGKDSENAGSSAEQRPGAPGDSGAACRGDRSGQRPRVVVVVARRLPSVMILEDSDKS